MSLLQACDIGVQLGGKAVLRHVDVTAAAGELVGLIGPNGAGKTTLLRVLAGLVPTSTGHVHCHGRAQVTYSMQERARLIAYLAQGGSTHWPLTVEKLVRLGRLPHRRGWSDPGQVDDEIVARMLAATDTSHLRDRRVDTLSGGERVRVLLARALAVEAPILLVDEPVAALDPYHQLQVMGVLHETAQRGRALVAVLHDLTLAARFCDRLVLLKEGKVLVEGRPADVLTDAHLAAAFGVSTVHGVHEGQRYVLPWQRLENESR